MLWDPQCEPRSLAVHFCPVGNWQKVLRLSAAPLRFRLRVALSPLRTAPLRSAPFRSAPLRTDPHRSADLFLYLLLVVSTLVLSSSLVTCCDHSMYLYYDLPYITVFVLYITVFVLYDTVFVLYLYYCMTLYLYCICTIFTVSL